MEPAFTENNHLFAYVCLQPLYTGHTVSPQSLDDISNVGPSTSSVHHYRILPSALIILFIEVLSSPKYILIYVTNIYSISIAVGPMCGRGLSWRS